jgi:uncharacterized membrane protein
MAWAVKDYDDASGRERAFWNLSTDIKMYGDASKLVAFRLMPLEPRFLKPIEAQWDFKVVDMDRRLVAFRDLSHGEITSWQWQFGDGTTSNERHPVHTYRRGGEYIVKLEVTGPAGASRRIKVWDVVLK